MSLFDLVPKVVEIQHTCHCESALERPRNEEDIVHKFTVDDVEFPWFISKEGPRISQIWDEFYAIEVDIQLLDKGTKDFLPFGYDLEDGNSAPTVPIIAGVRFPWLLHEDGCVLTFSRKQIPTLNLKFFALQVITNLDITDERAASA